MQQRLLLCARAIDRHRCRGRLSGGCRPVAEETACSELLSKLRLAVQQLRLACAFRELSSWSAAIPLTETPADKNARQCQSVTLLWVGAPVDFRTSGLQSGICLRLLLAAWPSLEDVEPCDEAVAGRSGLHGIFRDPIPMSNRQASPLRACPHTRILQFFFDLGMTDARSHMRTRLAVVFTIEHPSVTTWCETRRG